MSSGNLVLPDNSDAFAWSDGLDTGDFIFARYRVSATCSGEHAALGMAMEQSAATLSIEGYVTPRMLESWTIRVRKVESVAADQQRTDARGQQRAVEPYYLSTEVYAAPGSDDGHFDIELAVPLRLVAGKTGQLLNIVVGELPRLGFLTSFCLLDLRLPPGFGPGPAFGAAGILGLLDKSQGPLLCRSMRPAVGLDTQVMARLNRDVLVGGFHLVKDDELAVFTDFSRYRQHLQAMLAARDEAMQVTGERKLYIANLLCEPDELLPRWELVNQLGVDAVLVAPFIQGLGIVPMLARQAQMPLLIHNAFGDTLTRNPRWGIDDTAVCQLVRQLGADWFVTPGPFASAGMDLPQGRRLLRAATGECGGLPAMMPIIQGGKHPGGLPEYRAAADSTDFMLIVAHWVDSHPQGLAAAARIFREAIENG